MTELDRAVRKAALLAVGGVAKIGIAAYSGLPGGEGKLYDWLTALVDRVDGKANTAHNHAGEDIDSGTVGVARIGTGTKDATTFYSGNGTFAVPPGTGGSAVNVERNNSTIVTGASAIDFSTAFNVAADGTEADVSPSFGTTSGTFAEGNDSRFTKHHPFTFFYSGDVATKTGVGHDIAMVAGTIDQIRVSADSAPAGGSITVTFVKEAGGAGGTTSTIGTITLAASSKNGSTTGLSVSMSAGDTVRMDVTTNAGYTAASCKNLTGKARMSY